VGDDDELVVNADVRIPARELEWRFGPSSGPGGQHANRAHTRAEVRFDVAGSSVLRAHDRKRLLDRLGDTVTAACDDERSQLRNRRVALDRLRRTLLDALRPPVPRRPTRPTRGSVEARLAAKRRQAGRKAERRPPTAD
jgi:ribosome-associated protein